MAESTIIHIAGVVLRNVEGRYLLVQETRPDIHGLWGIPAGHQDEREELHQTAIREAKEETGYTVELLSEEPFYEGNVKMHNHVFHAYLAQVTGGTLRIQKGEILDAKWITFSRILDMNSNGEIRDPVIMAIIQKAEDAYNRH